MIVSARPMMKPLSTGSEMNEARKPRRSSPASERDDADGERERGGQRDELVAGSAPRVADDAGGQRRGRRHRGDDEVARAAEQRVEDQGRDGGVQADDRRDAGDRGVGERLRDQHRPHGQAGEHVAADPGRPEPAERRRDHAAPARRGPVAVGSVVTRTTQPGDRCRCLARFR